jgi:hypothetical protein
MDDDAIPDPVRPALESLREYMYSFYPERRLADPFPLAFWTLDDELFEEFLLYLPLQMVISSGADPDLAAMPEGFRLAYFAYHLEDDYDFNGWTALTNAGTDRLPGVIQAYERMGLRDEARAVAAALAAIEEDPEDTDAAEEAYQGVDSEFADEDVRRGALFDFFRANTALFEG